MLILSSFTDFIKKHDLFASHHQILLAVSGGKDSVLMTHLFKKSGFNFGIAHCNFNLRNHEAQRDEAFVKQLATTLNVPFFVKQFDTLTYANQNQLSTQMAARTLRYEWFEHLRQTEGYDFIALAHHQNDSLETLLLNLIRGTGISGLHGILPKRDFLVRPLLFLSRQQIDEVVNEHEINFVEDSSNASTTYARNKIRLNVIPQLREINPNLAHTFAQNIARFTETEQVLHQVVADTRLKIQKSGKDYFYFSIAEIEALKPKKLLLFELLKDFNFTDSVVEEILDSLHKQSGTSFYSSTHRATIDRDNLVISLLAVVAEKANYLLHSSAKEVAIGQQKITFTTSHHLIFEATPSKIYLDFDQLIFPLVVRFRQNGDKFMPLGMSTFKKISDFFIDEKVPLPQKDTIPLLVNGNGQIIWVVGLRQDHRFKLTENTKKVAILELLNQ
jgi:tRNA(Ile)-lysidine synthase